MNDHFLYELRSPPPPQFAARLKARLDLQASEGRQRRRAFRWFVFGAIMMGGTALAFVSPSVRQATMSMIMHFGGGAAQPEVVAPPAPRAVEREQPVSTEQEWQEPEVTNMVVAAPADEYTAAAVARASSPQRTAVPGTTQGATGGQSSVAAAGGWTSVVNIGYGTGLEDFSEALVMELPDGAQASRIEALSRPEGASLCAADLANVDIVLSDRELIRDQSPPCANGRSFIKLQLAHDAVAIVTHRENTWARSISLADLRKFSEFPDNPSTTPVNAVTTWSQVRSDWPTLPIAFVVSSLRDSKTGRHIAALLDSQHGPTVLVTAKDDRATLALVDYELRDRALGAIGFVSFATLDAVRRERAWPTVASFVNENGEAVEPTTQSIQSRRYTLSWPVWVYVDRERVAYRHQVWQVMQALFEKQPPKTIEAQGLIATTRAEREAAMEALTKARTRPRNQ